MLSNPKKLALHLLVGVALTMITACGGETKTATQSTPALTGGGGSGDALDPRDVSLTAPGPRGCYDPADFNAKPDDGEDDREPAQKALDAASIAGGRVCFGPGRWHLSRAPAGTYNRFAALSTHGVHVEIVGAGPSTILDVSGEQGGGKTVVISIDPGAKDVKVKDLTIDTSGMTNTDEQSHAIEIGSAVCTTTNGTCSMPVEDISVEGVRFLHPTAPPGQRKGDCIRLLGNTVATRVQRVKIIGATFATCARSGIAVQRNVNSLKVIGNHFLPNRWDQAFEGEASGGEADARLELIGNTFDEDIAIAQGDHSVALTSQAGAIVSGNTFNGRGIKLYRTTDVTLTGNTFDATMDSGEGVIEVGNVAERLVIGHNVVRRRGAGGPLVRIQHHSGRSAAHVTIDANQLRNDTAGNGIHMESAQDASITSNDLHWSMAASSSFGIFLSSIIRPADGVSIQGNRIDGALSAAVFLAARQPFESVSVVGNMARGPSTGLLCKQSVAGLFHQPVVHASNAWLPAASSAIDCPMAILVPQRP
jgi:hypothetical protein